MLAAFRRFTRLKPYADDLEERLTGRLELSLALIQEQAAAEQILDIGCSRGWLEKTLEGSGTARVVGIEPSPEVIARARALYPSGRFEVASVLSLPFENDTFDGVVMLEVLEHIPRNTEAEAFRELRRVMKTGAWFVFSTPFAHPIATLLDPAWYFGHRHYTARTLEALFTDAGFQVDKVFVRGAWWEAFGTISLYVFKWIFRSEDPFKEQIERGRTREFLTMSRGMTNVFVLARAI
jgi:SAM-dependent methyltransferase